MWIVTRLAPPDHPLTISPEIFLFCARTPIPDHNSLSGLKCRPPVRLTFPPLLPQPEKLLRFRHLIPSGGGAKTGDVSDANQQLKRGEKAGHLFIGPDVRTSPRASRRINEEKARAVKRASIVL
jgi:hypothetical protein